MTSIRQAAQGELFSVAPNRAPTSQYPAVESFWIDSHTHEIVRSVRRRRGGVAESRLAVGGRPNADLSREFDRRWLRTASVPAHSGTEIVRIADLFSGCGLMTLGVAEAVRAIGARPEPVIAIDSNPVAAGVYLDNFPTAHVFPTLVETYVNGARGQRPTTAESELVEKVGRIDVLIGGPPCQGHSDLNNHTRRRDSRNALFIKMARFAELTRPDHIIIENVKGILHDVNDVYAKTWDALEELGYQLDGALLDASDFGVAQRRQRHFLVASMRREIKLEDMLRPYRVEVRDFRWACGDLLGREVDPLFDGAPTPSAENRRRINYLFERELHDLPNSQRPQCHRDKYHTYRSVYGRLKWDKPAQTITTGFGSMGQGRYVHPLERRTITPHEAARLQFIPDFFRFANVGRAALAEMIGNAIPAKLTYVTALELLR
jgi:DNA (cytosine-5)-methyltransferase 1